MMPRVGAKLAPRHVALTFSVESVWAPAPFGFHAAFKWLSQERMAELLGTISYDLPPCSGPPDGEAKAAGDCEH